MFSYKHFKGAVRSLIRNKWLTFATVTVMTLTLFTVSVFVILNILVSSTIDTVESKIDLEVYFKPAVAEDDILDIKKDVSKMPEIKNVQYISTAEALKIFKQMHPDLDQAVSEVDNPLNASLKIDLYKVEDLGKINSLFVSGKYSALVESSSYKGDIVSRFINFRTYVTWFGIILSLVFLVTSLIVVLNTIRMTIYTRREEIEIMKLVGATNWYIRWPFILEGAFYGFISMILSSIALFIGLKIASPHIRDFFQEFSINFFSSLNAYGLIILGWQFVISVFVGVVSSTIAISRYLKV
ncbi:MAG: permease-like cell division protein FtsX [Patescibacteria group bacterium]|nr:permease-like cell division protein FtsX [Patescibacteria group bacterium]